MVIVGRRASSWRRAVGASARRSVVRALAAVAALAGLAVIAAADTLPDALARAYSGNPTLAANRAGLRATDENVPRALAGFRPTVAASASAGASQVASRGLPAGNERTSLFPRQVGLQASQNLFDGFRTTNLVRQAESEVLSGRETLRQVEQDTLFAGAQAYMDVLRDTAVLDLQRNNEEVLVEQASQTRERNVAGQVTRTDVAQAEARLAAARSQVSLAGANLQASVATYRRVIGVEPRRLAPGRPPDRLVPATLVAAVRTALATHPAVRSALHAVDVAELQVKVVEGELAPRVDLVGSVGQAYAAETPRDRTFSVALLGQVTVPLYEGGEVYARVRQVKETAGQRRIEAEATRDAVRAAVVVSWGSLESAKANALAAAAQVRANEVALAGVREEARVGQRTTLDVLNQQQELLIARVNLVTAQRDRVVGAYAVAQSTGSLSPEALGLTVARYSPGRHYEQVRDLPWGLRTPDGR